MKKTLAFIPSRLVDGGHVQGVAFAQIACPLFGEIVDKFIWEPLPGAIQDHTQTALQCRKFKRLSVSLKISKDGAAIETGSGFELEPEQRRVVLQCLGQLFQFAPIDEVFGFGPMNAAAFNIFE